MKIKGVVKEYNPGIETMIEFEKEYVSGKNPSFTIEICGEYDENKLQTFLNKAMGKCKIEFSYNKNRS